MLDILRSIKRKVLTEGFAETVYLFLKEIEKEDRVFKHPDNEFLVNLNFDLELGFGTTFWEGNIAKSLSYGKTSRKNLIPFLRYFSEEKIPANIQIAGALLDPEASNLSIFNDEQRKAMFEHRDLFKLTDDDIELLKIPSIETGLHGFSHRHFTNISDTDAEYEIKSGVTKFQKHFQRNPEFMAFPKNCVAHTDIIQKYGIKSWRADSQHPNGELEVPLGHWFSPGVLGREDLKHALKTIKEKKKGFLLQLWGHFTEMDARTFRELVGVIKESGWKLTTIKDFKKY